MTVRAHQLNTGVCAVRIENPHIEITELAHIGLFGIEDIWDQPGFLIGEFGGSHVQGAVTTYCPAVDNGPGVLDDLGTVLVPGNVHPAQHPRRNLTGGEVGLDQGKASHYQPPPNRARNSRSSPRVCGGSS
ncbi:hypothetical protein D3C75_1000450 [compost metagenome]